MNDARPILYSFDARRGALLAPPIYCMLFSSYFYHILIHKFLEHFFTRELYNYFRKHKILIEIKLLFSMQIITIKLIQSLSTSETKFYDNLLSYYHQMFPSDMIL